MAVPRQGAGEMKQTEEIVLLAVLMSVLELDPDGDHEVLSAP